MGSLARCKAIGGMCMLTIVYCLFLRVHLTLFPDWFVFYIAILITMTFVLCIISEHDDFICEMDL